MLFYSWNILRKAIVKMAPLSKIPDFVNFYLKTFFCKPLVRNNSNKSNKSGQRERRPSSDPSTALAGRRGNGLLLVAASWSGWPSECEVEDASRAPLPCAAPRRTALPGSCHSPWWGGKASRHRGEKAGPHLNLILSSFHLRFILDLQFF